MARPANIPGTERKVNKLGARSRNLERRVIPQPPLPPDWATADVPVAPHTNPSGDLFDAAAPVPLHNVQVNGIDDSDAANGNLTLVRAGLYLVNVSGVVTTSADDSPASVRAFAPGGGFEISSGPVLPHSVGGRLALVAGSGLIRAEAGDVLALHCYSVSPNSTTIQQGLTPGYSVVRVAD